MQAVPKWSFQHPTVLKPFTEPTLIKKHVALTFNISWGEQNVEPILDILEQNQIDKATFFRFSALGRKVPRFS